MSTPTVKRKTHTCTGSASYVGTPGAGASFSEWCDETGYLGIKGKHKGDGSVDCIINELGYIDGNIRVLTVEANAEKGIKYVDYNVATGDWDLVTWNPSPQPADDLPF